MTCAKKKDRVAAASPKLRCMFDHTFVRQASGRADRSGRWRSRTTSLDHNRVAWVKCRN